jgi:cob(I)alamin adenosyltransferase
LISLSGLLELIKYAPKNIELVLTGRNAHPKIIKLADLVSQVKEVKHYYNQGVKARRGIEF